MRWDSSSGQPFCPLIVVLNHRECTCSLKASGIKNNWSDNIWINIGCWPSIFNIAFTIIMHYLSWNSEWGSSISTSIWKLINARSFMDPCQSFMVISSIKANVKGVFSFKFFHHIVNIIHSSRTLSHNFSWKVGMASRSIPIAENFGFKTYW